MRYRLAPSIFLMLAAGCSRRHVLTVGSKNFTEQLILGEIVAQHLEKRLGVQVDRKLNLGGTLLTHQALVNGAIDLYPEYTGTALTTILKEPAQGDPAAVLQRVRDEYRRRWNLIWLEPFGFDNTFAMVIRRDDARGVATLSDATQREWRLGVGYEFLRRPDGLPGLLKTYALPIQGAPVSMDLGLLYRALEQKQVDMVAASSTDGMLSVLNVLVLRDDRRFFPPYQAAVVARAEILAASPGLEKALAELSGGVSQEAMRKLNYEVDGRHRAIGDVARDFLAGRR